MVVAHPSAWESHLGHYTPPVQSAVDGVMNLGVDVVDVLGAWHASGMVTAENYQSFFWPLDFHNNSKGYALFGGIVADHLTELGVPPR